ncbi:c-type cytochrome [Sulfitobacter sp. D35]|uniref:c-type cytochrome n=1 Tax=Sulfitobacter sp. D35 TaxID=3083252 RepID=UPI00296EDE6B|nr:c-type cytochrome [Sulfitobacter sp. D35]MDW4497389.1 c-type cytochrome [Sulfitobacter sp. D35]
MTKPSLRAPGAMAPCRHMLMVLAFSLLCPSAEAQEFFTLKGHGGPIKGIATAPDGTVLTASFDNSVGLWRDGEPFWLEGHAAAVNAVVFAGGTRVVSAGDDFTLRLWDTEAGTGRVLGEHLGKIIRLVVSPDGARVASASWDGTARIWSLDGEDAELALEGHESAVNDVAFSPDGTRVYTASADGTIRVWDSTTGAAEGQLVRHGFGVNALVLAPDESWIAYGAVDGGTRVLSLPEGTAVQDFTLDRRPILAMAHSPQARRIAVGDAQGFIMMVDTEGWRISEDFRASLTGPIWALAFSSDGQNIHAGGLDNAMYSWPLAGLDAAQAMPDAERSFLTPPEEMSNGERQFQRKCSICHTLGPDGARRAGPSLHGLFGRAAGSLDGYSYSDTLETAGIVWTDETIDRLFDLGPDHFIPGSKMPMQRITAPRDRQDLIAFLRAATAP